MVKNKRLYLIPIKGFFSLILIGTVLLLLPVCNNKNISIIDSLFTATSSICVTGFSTVTISDQFSLLGQIIIAILMQIGALGFMIFIQYIYIIKNKKMKFSNILLVSDSINVDDYTKIKEKTIKILKYTFIIELIGAIILSTRFIPRYGIIEGIWYGIFHSISAFCNAGLDLFSGSSLATYRYDTIVNIVFIALIITGGIGFFVIEDIIDYIKQRKKHKFTFQTKLVVSSTLIILAISTLLIYFLEMNNNVRIIDALFASVTTRTAGFYTIDFNSFSISTKIISIILMFIGGAPGSTSGGVRIAAIAVLFITSIQTLYNRKNVIIFNRKIEPEIIKKAVAIVFISVIIIITSIFLLIFFDNFGTLNIVFATVSAFSATGLTLFDMSMLNLAGKIIIIITMFIGRIGPMSLIPGLFLIERKRNENITYVDANILL